MADIYFEKLKKEKEKQGELASEICIKVGTIELDVLQKKAEILGTNVGDLLRGYLLQTGVFDASVFAEKKAKKVKGGE